MRLRHIPGSEEEIANSPYVVSNPEEKKGRWSEVFGNDNPIEIEVGMGKGRFIMELASKNPGINYVGIERYCSVLLRGIQKRQEMELSNIYFMCVDARELSDIFAPGEVKKIYLNFSDPWPKDRHAKRRLTSEPFMEVYDKILAPDGVWSLRRTTADCLTIPWKPCLRLDGRSESIRMTYTIPTWQREIS